MAYLGNTPGQSTILRIEARKSFALGVRIVDHKGRPADLTGCVLTIVAKTPDDTESGDGTNLLIANSTAVIESPKTGYGRFNLQASDLDQVPGEYPYAIVLRTAAGYSSVIVKGLLEILQNTEYTSTDYTYSGINPPQTLGVMLRQNHTINVFIDGQLPPGMNYVRDDILEAIEGFDPDAIAMVPTGGVGGYVLTKTSSGDYSMAWLPVGNGAFALDATNQPEGMVPTAVGDDTWIWSAPGLDATDVPPGYAPVSDGGNGWNWAQVQTTVDWDIEEGEPGSILNKPTLGTAAAADAEDFISSETIVSDMAGVHFQTTVPSTGVDGHLYFVYTE